MLVNIALVQHTVGDPVGIDLKLHLFRKRADFICFPEYWGAVSSMSDLGELSLASHGQRAVMSRLSADLRTIVIGGTVVVLNPAGMMNTAPVFDRGRPLGEYSKRYPTPSELKRGIVPGPGPRTWTHRRVTFGIAICADCLTPETFDRYARLGTDILFVPNASPYRPGDSAEAKFQRDEEIFVAGAKRMGAYIVKVCGVGEIFGHPLQGRSLVAAPWGVLNRVPPSEENRSQVLAVTLSTDELHEFRRSFAKSAYPAGDIGSDSKSR